jgi:diguanylate cyclase (GGDEF)-like protein
MRATAPRPALSDDAVMKTILVIDDRVEQREQLVALLSNGGHTAIEASDASDAVRILADCTPDLIITELTMPTFGVLEFATWLRSDPATAAVPLMFLTSAWRVESARHWAQSCGAACVLSKATEPAAVLATVAAALRDTAAAHAQEPVASAPGDALLARNARLAAFADSSIALSRGRETSELVASFCRVAQDIIDCRYAAVGIIDERGHRPKFLATRGLETTVRERLLATDPDTTIIGEAIASGGTICMHREGQEPAALGLPQFHPPLRDLLVLPLPIWSTTSLTGFAYFADRTDGARFDAEDQHLATALAAQFAPVFGNLLLREQEQYRARNELAHDVPNDLTTGLPRFVMLEEYLHGACVEAAAQDGRVIVFYVDLDRFHATNDTRGRAVGDLALRAVGERLRKIIGDAGRVAHVGGDEFAIVLKDSARVQDQVEFGDAIRSLIEEPMSYQDGRIYLTCSVGVSCFPDNGSGPQELLRQAESAMLLAKNEGRNSVVAFANEQKQELDDRLNLGMRLNDALRNGEFLLYYQPRINGQDWRISGFEALLRWQSPDLGLLTPKRFHRVAEDMGLMVDVGSFVLESACRQARAWIDAGADDFAISINVSPGQMQRTGFAAEVRRALTEFRLPARYIELELIESMVTGNIERVTSTMRELKALGVRLSLDDFGTGYSSLNYLRRFPIDTLKIDQSFVSDISIDPGAAGVCRAIITLGHQLGMTVLAEGVETAAQVGYLRRNDCDFFQGYYFCKPISATQALEILRHRYLPHEGLEQTAEQPTLLLVDDEENILNAITRMLRRDGYRILTATGAEDALDILGRNDVQVVISDQRMPGISGTELLSKVKEMYPDTVRIVLSGYTDLSAVTAAINQGAIYKFITKPWNDEELRMQIRDAFRIAHRPEVARKPA